MGATLRGLRPDDLHNTEMQSSKVDDTLFDSDPETHFNDGGAQESPAAMEGALLTAIAHAPDTWRLPHAKTEGTAVWTNVKQYAADIRRFRCDVQRRWEVVR